MLPSLACLRYRVSADQSNCQATVHASQNCPVKTEIPALFADEYPLILAAIVICSSDATIILAYHVDSRSQDNRSDGMGLLTLKGMLKP